MQMAAAFASEGARVTLFHDQGEARLGDPFAWYGVDRRFALHRYPRRAGATFRKRFKHPIRWLTDITFVAHLGFVLRPNIVYGLLLPWLARWLRSPWAAAPNVRTGLELHEPPRRPKGMDLLREIAASPRLTGIVVISAPLRDQVLDLLPSFPASRVLIARNGVDLVDQAAASDPRRLLGPPLSEGA
jgi:hypothetical protein